MRDREEFVAMSCAFGMQAIKNPAERAQFVRDLHATAVAVADALGLTEDGHGERGVASEHVVRATEEATRAREDLFKAHARIADLEAQLEQATAPAAKASARAGGR